MMKFNPVEYAKSHIPPPGHQRTYITAYAIGMMANGAFLPIYVLYLTQIVGISTSKTALAIGIAGLIGLPLTLVAGDLADRLGPRRVVLFGLVGQVAGIASYVFIQGFWSLLAIVMSMNVFAYAYLASEGALLRRIGGDDTVKFRSQVQVLGSIAVTVGAVGAGIGISIGSALAYRTMFLAVAAVYLVVIAITLRIPDYKPLPKPTHAPAPEPDGSAPPESTGQGKPQRWIVLRDKPFIAYAVVSGLMTVSAFVEHQLLPLWIVVFTPAPPWTVALAFVASTAISVVLQMRLSKDVRTTRQGGSALLRAGFMLLLACLVLVQMPYQTPATATILVIAGVAFISIAQIWLISGRFVFEFNLPPAHAQGQYDGFLNTVMTLSITGAPLVLIGFVAERGSVGWVVIGVVFVLLGLTGPSIAAWAERTRPQEEDPTESDGADPLVAVGADPVVAAGTDLVVANVGANAIVGNGGPDPLVANVGASTVAGNGGPDPVLANVGASTVTGNGGPDPVVANVGASTVTANGGPDPVLANVGGNAVVAKAGADPVVASAAANAVAAKTGTDALVARAGTSTIVANAGSTIVANAGTNTIVTNAGMNTVVANAGATIVANAGATIVLNAATIVAQPERTAVDDH